MIERVNTESESEAPFTTQQVTLSGQPLIDVLAKRAINRLKMYEPPEGYSLAFMHWWIYNKDFDTETFQTKIEGWNCDYR